jgi:hypothetical protein
MPRVTIASLQDEIARLQVLAQNAEQFRQIATQQSNALANAEREVTKLIGIIQSQAQALASMASKTGTDY